MTHPATPCVLILGGTGEARRLASDLATRSDLRVVSTLAGRVRAPRLPAGEVRIGGFGGPAGLAGWLRAERVSAIVDATHPFAERISASAAEAAAVTGIPILRLRRPGWVARPGDDWRWVDSLAAAAALVADTGRRAFLTTGRQGLAAFAGLDAAWFLIRCVDEPEPPLPKHRLLLLDRGPYTVDGELDLLRTHRIDLLVSKDSGGEQTGAKLTAARELGLPVLMVRRPPEPDLPAVPTAAATLRWLDTVLR
jgi:precorrin-6A/cobalt-precorrin-6A reductase